ARVAVSVVTAPEFVALVRRVENRPAVVRLGGRTLAIDAAVQGAGNLPLRGKVKRGGVDYRVATFRVSDFRGVELSVSVLSKSSAASSAISTGGLAAAAALVGFLALAFGFAIAVSRSLQAQIARFLEAARRLGEGDFSTEVPSHGHDEFAALGEEFNKMSRQLAARLEELRRERARLEEAVRRTGETVAANLDRDALLELLVQTAVVGVGASGGRVSALEAQGRRLEEVARAGSLEGFDELVRNVEGAALATGEPAELDRGDARALSCTLRAEERPDAPVIGVISVVRSGRPFTATERDLFGYLGRQAAISVENVELHELVQRQAVTDELTGLSNHRRFQDLLANEVERHRRFSQPLGLVMLDIDDFKAVNDTYGHQQGDLVLREVARVLREMSREIDEPARYGGEEFAIALPQTDLEGAVIFAERVRAGISSLSVKLLDQEGELRVTASFGAAALDGAVDDKTSLVAAADAALYRAKRSGKNRTERAAPDRSTASPDE
ncbi:MAG TPA: diguanylate cyclase, partial [Solirubrobacteraceae bacterium]|nr:diguanylate cyclase [Solirubrobacteraceae bacterium]